MKKILALILLLFTNIASSDCIFGLNNINQIDQFKDVIRCLQDDINSIKLQESSTTEKVSNRYYTVQVIATSSMDYALEIKDSFKSYGYRSFITISNNDKKTSNSNWYKVMIGKFKWRSAAELEKTRIKSQHPVYEDIFITSVIARGQE